MRRALLLLALAGCQSRPSVPSPPRAEFLVSAGDSTYWVAAGPAGLRVRGSPILLARYGARFYEIYVADDDYSYPDALMVGERMYTRDIRSGDSTVVFADTIVARIALAYARALMMQLQFHLRLFVAQEYVGRIRNLQREVLDIDLLDAECRLLLRVVRLLLRFVHLSSSG